MRNNPDAFDDTSTLESREHPDPRMTPGPRTVRDPLAPNSAAWRFWKGVMVGALAMLLIAGVAYFFSQGDGLDTIRSRVSPSTSTSPSGAPSIPRSDATISVRTIPSGANISVDFQPEGRTPMLDHSIGQGSHVLSLRMDGFVTFDTLITVRGGEVHDLAISLSEARRGVSAPPVADDEDVATDIGPSAPAPSSPVADPAPTAGAPAPSTDADEVRRGSVTIVSEPAGAAVMADGRLLGETPLRGVLLDEGNYSLRFTLPGHHLAEESVVVRADEEASVSVAMVAEQGRLRVLALPWATIFIDGELLHENTDLRHTVELAAGNHVIRAEHPVLGTVERSVRVIAGETSDVVLDLNP